MTKRSIYLVAAGVLLAGLIGAIPSSAANTIQKKQLAREQFEQAQKLRDALNRIPEQDRTRRDYERVTEAYRRVYYTAPTSAKADEAVVGVAETLADIGRRFNDPKMLHAAIGQYEFLRREYPGSKLRVNALFSMGQIYSNDLNDVPQAKATFQEYLKHYPKSLQAADARRAIAEIDNPRLKQKRLAREKKEAVESVASAARNGRKDASLAPQQASAPPGAAESPATESPAQTTDRSIRAEKPEKRNGTQFVTGIRHWSTPDYTRVAIDLDAEVKYEAGRIPSPDRIFFDLHDTRLSSSLVGKTFEVEDGFLRKIRVAQFQRGLTRVVLDVADVSDYSAFLLPNPYRLIIDIHGKKVSKPQTLIAAKSADQQGRTDLSAQQAPQSDRVPVKISEGPATLPRHEAAQGGLAERRKDNAQLKSDKPTAELIEKRTTDVDSAVRQSEPDTNSDNSKVYAAKATQPEFKATDKPTSSPTFESVAPRDSGERKASTRRRRQVAPEVTGREARPTADGERSLIRALGLKIGKIVVDAGHGGHDTGTIGPNGLQEKDLVLDVALRLGKLLQRNMGASVVYTRDDDTFIPLETRTAIANQAQADLFISVHANSSSDSTARGVETYYLNFTSSAEALEVAARENAVSAKSIHELQDLVKKITLKEKIDESREFAADVQRSLYSGLSAKSPAVRNRGVKKAPFIVLIGANMPSILAEISFLSNPTDEKRLETPEYRQKIAEYLYKGISRYVSGLSGVKVASSQAPKSARGSEGDR